MIQLLLIIAALFSGSAQAHDEKASTVTIPLEEYLALKEKDKSIQFTSVEEIRLTGAYRQDLNLTLLGSASTYPKEIQFMEINSKVTLSHCKGQAALSLNDNFITLIPQAKRFELSCKVKLKSWDQVSFNFLNALTVQSDVKGMESVVETSNGRDQRVVLHGEGRKVASAPDEEPSVVGRYRISLLQDENAFEYRIKAYNPNSTMKAFRFDLRNGEIVQRFDTSAKYEQTNGGYSIKLSPGDTEIVVTGRLTTSEFKPPFGHGLEYLLVETHPILTSTIESKARRISPQDSQIYSRFSAPRAYILSKQDKVSWNKKTLEVFSASTYAIKGASYNYFWSTLGKSFVQADFNFNNQGATEIPLKIEGKPLYLEINGRPQALSKNDKDDLVLRVPTGDDQHVTVQYQLEQGAPRTLASLSQELARPDGIMTNVGMTLSLPKGYDYLFVTNGLDHRMPINWFAAILGLIAFLLIYKFLEGSLLTNLVHLILSASIGFLTFCFPVFFPWVFFAVSLAVVYRQRHKLFQDSDSPWGRRAKAVFLSLALFASTYFISNLGHYFLGGIDESPSSSRYAESGSSPYSRGGQLAAMATALVNTKGSGYGNGSGYGSGIGAQAKSKDVAKSYNALREGAVAEAAAPQPEEGHADQGDSLEYQGLPAKVEIPVEGQQISFTTGITDQSSKIVVRAVAIKQTTFRTITILNIFLIIGLIWFKRRELLEFGSQVA